MGSDLGGSDNEDCNSQGGKKSSSSNIALTQRTAEPGVVEIVSCKMGMNCANGRNANTCVFMLAQS